MYYYILSTLMLLILTAVILLMISYYQPEVLAHLWNKIINNSCEQQDSPAINGIPSYYSAELSKSVDTKLLHQLLQLYCNEVLTEILPYIADTNDDILPISAKMPVLKSIIDNVPQIISAHIIVCRPGMTITGNNTPFRFIQRYCYTLQTATYDVGLNLGGYDVKWEPETGMVWDSNIRQTIWNHTKSTRILIVADLYRPLPLLEYIGSKVVHYLCHELLTNKLEAAELARVKMIA